MPVMIQVRNVPERVHRVLKSRAAASGTTLSDYLRRELERIASMPTEEELFERIRRRKPVRLDTAPAELIRAERERR